VTRVAEEVRVGIDVRRAELRDADSVAEMCAELWPHGPAEEHRREFEEKTRSGMSGTLPVAIFVATDAASDALVGFVEVGMRSHAEGCDTAQPSGYVEGLFVREPVRRSGLGAALMRAAEDWARAQGCREMASDAHIDNQVSHRVHAALGYEEVERSVNFHKKL
jgi:aminoglycoside 6'-N-acetyltransferase I